MAVSFLGGLLVAETASQLVLGVFFVLAFGLVRREAGYLLFGVLCWAIAGITAGGAITRVLAPGYCQLGLGVAQISAMLAVALHVHFVGVLALAPGERRVISLAAYAAALVYGTIYLSGQWWQGGSSSGPPALGILASLQGCPIPSLTLWGKSFYWLTMGEVLFSFVVLVRAVRAGQRQVWLATLGLGVALVAVVHDSLFLLGVIRSTLAVPHLFSAYAFAVALSLLQQYRDVSTGLMDTTSTLRQKTDELRRSHADLEQMQAELGTKKQLAAVGELAAAIAHEVRNPLAIIMNAVAGLRRPTLKEEDRHVLLGIVDEETARLNRLVTDLLRFARPVTLRLTAVSLVELVHRAEIRGSENHHQVVCHFRDDTEGATVQADANLLRLVFDNLVSNAVQAMPEGGTVTIEVNRGAQNGPRSVCIEVKDEGLGMEEHVLNRATDPFFTTRPSGTGLGLPIVQRIIQAHGGRVEIESLAGHGTTVRLLLPDPESGADEPKNQVSS